MSDSRRSSSLAMISSRGATIFFSGNLVLALKRIVGLGVRGFFQTSRDKSSCAQRNHCLVSINGINKILLVSETKWG
jgi:hypothetical protein